MKASTAYNHRERALGALRDLYAGAVTFCPTSSELVERSCRIKASVSHCPQWVISYLEGWERAVRDMVIRQHVFFYTMPDGSLVSTHRERADYYEKLGLGPREVSDQSIASGHYWINAAGEPRPFFVTETEKETQS